MYFYALAVASVGLLTAMELTLGARLGGSRLLNIQLWAVKAVLGFALLPIVSLSVPFSLIDGLSWPATFAIYFVVMDLGEYLFHRAQHAIPWLWRLHAVHHSDPDMNATTTERHFWGDQFLKAMSIWPAAAFIIRPTPLVVSLYLLVTLWNYLSHARVPLNFGRLSWLLNSPAYHRRHHSSLPEHYNSNFAAILPVWDVLAGSYHQPDRGMPPTGLEWNPRNLFSALTLNQQEKRTPI